MRASRFRQLLFGIFIGLVGIAVNLTPVGLVLEEEYGLDWLFQLRGVVPAPNDVVVISIDQPSATELGLEVEPRLWPRDLHARLIEKIADAGARVIAFDLIFKKPSNIPVHDEALFSAMQKARNVVVVERLEPKISQSANQAGLTPLGIVKEKVDEGGESNRFLRAVENATLAQAPFPIPDAANVKVYWTFKESAGDMPTLPVIVFQAYVMTVYDDFLRLLAHVNPALTSQLPNSKETVDIEELIYTLRHIFSSEPQLAHQILTKLKQDAVLNAEQKKLIHSLVKLYSGSKIRYLNFFGPPRSVQTVPYHLIVQSPESDSLTFNYAEFKDKVVFVGVSAEKQTEQDIIRDTYQTVFVNTDGLNISGVEIAATAFANLLEDKPVKPLPVIENLGVLFLMGFVLGIVFLVLPNRSATIFGVVLVAIYVVNANYQFKETGTWLPLFIPLFMQLPLAIFGSLSFKYYNEKRERKQIEEQFGRFLPERVVKHIKKSAGQITFNNQMVYGVCLATDVEDYTPLSEKMSPGRLSQLMNDYYAVLFEPVEKYGGDVSDVVGDAMLALWTAPSANSDLREKACLACLVIAAAIDRFNQVDNRPKMVTRFGLHFGEMILGTVGASRHFEYRAVGDVVNTTNRIQGANKKLGTRLLLSGEVAEGLDDFLIRPLGDFFLTGKTSPVNLAELVAQKQVASTDQLWLCKIFASALQAYQSGKWQQACDGFSEILGVLPDDGPSQFFLAHCQQHNLVPPVGLWPTAIQMSTK